MRRDLAPKGQEKGSQGHTAHQGSSQCSVLVEVPSLTKHPRRIYSQVQVVREESNQLQGNLPFLLNGDRGMGMGAATQMETRFGITRLSLCFPRKT